MSFGRSISTSNRAPKASRGGTSLILPPPRRVSEGTGENDSDSEKMARTPTSQATTIQHSLLATEKVPKRAGRASRSVNDISDKFKFMIPSEQNLYLNQIIDHGGRVINFSVVTAASKNAVFLASLAVINFLFVLALAGVSIAVVVGEVDISLKIYGFVLAFVILFLIAVAMAYGVFNLYRYDNDLSPWHKARLSTPYVMNLCFSVLIVIMITIYLRVDSTSIDRSSSSEFTALAAVLIIPVVVAIMNAREIVPSIMCARYQEGQLPGVFVLVVDEFDDVIQQSLRNANIDVSKGSTIV